MKKDDIIIHKESKMKYQIIKKWFHVEKCIWIYTLLEIVSNEVFIIVDIKDYINQKELRNRIINEIIEPE